MSNKYHFSVIYWNDLPLNINVLPLALSKSVLKKLVICNLHVIVESELVGSL